MSKMIFINRGLKFAEFFDKSLQARDINFIILHHIEADSVEHAILQLKEHKVSSHFLINEDGSIFELVDENDIAYHAGVSNWKGIEGLNKCSIGIEFINSKAFEKSFTKAQMKAGLELCKYLMGKYNIKKENIIGHSDIAYDRETNLHNRKQDPSHLFDWKFLAENGVGVFPKIRGKNIKIFTLGDKNSQIINIKKKLQNAGYRLVNLNDEFDAEMQSLALVFNRKFLGEELDFWTKKSDAALNLI